MIAISAFIFKPIIGAERTHPPPCFIFRQQETGFINDIPVLLQVHTMLLVQQQPIHDEMVQLVPFPFIFIRAFPEIEKIIQLVRDKLIHRKGLCPQLNRKAFIFRHIIKIPHNQALGRSAHRQHRIHTGPKPVSGQKAFGPAGNLSSGARRHVANKDIHRIRGLYLPPNMKDIPGRALFLRQCYLYLFRA